MIPIWTPPSDEWCSDKDHDSTSGFIYPLIEYGGIILVEWIFDITDYRL